METFVSKRFPFNSKLMELKPISEPTQNGLNFELIRPFLKLVRRHFLLKLEGIFGSSNQDKK